MGYSSTKQESTTLSIFPQIFLQSALSRCRPAVEISIINDASDGTVLGGKAFAPQPRVEIHDLGGNILVDDSFSAVRISFYSNPSNGGLLPAMATTTYLEKGFVQFKGLSIDKADVGYRMTYEFLQYEDERLHETCMVRKSYDLSQ